MLKRHAPSRQSRFGSSTMQASSPTKAATSSTSDDGRTRDANSKRRKTGRDRPTDRGGITRSVINRSGTRYPATMVGVRMEGVVDRTVSELSGGAMIPSACDNDLRLQEPQKADAAGTQQPLQRRLRQRRQATRQQETQSESLNVCEDDPEVGRVSVITRESERVGSEGEGKKNGSRLPHEQQSTAPSATLEITCDSAAEKESGKPTESCRKGRSVIKSDEERSGATSMTKARATADITAAAGPVTREKQRTTTRGDVHGMGDAEALPPRRRRRPMPSSSSSSPPPRAVIEWRNPEPSPTDSAVEVGNVDGGSDWSRACRRRRRRLRLDRICKSGSISSNSDGGGSSSSIGSSSCSGGAPLVANGSKDGGEGEEAEVDVGIGERREVSPPRRPCGSAPREKVPREKTACSKRLPASHGPSAVEGKAPSSPSTAVVGWLRPTHMKRTSPVTAAPPAALYDVAEVRRTPGDTVDDPAPRPDPAALKTENEGNGRKKKVTGTRPPPPTPSAALPLAKREATGRTDTAAPPSACSGAANKQPSATVAASATAAVLRPQTMKRKNKTDALPPCPYPGHENISWTCVACGGGKHHLTSRSAMEPLQRAHGFKVHRVPNDGDCFFSSIEAALEAGTTGGLSSGSKVNAATVADTKTAAAPELTVAKMRNWVAEETGQEQLDFYILQAKANREERWLDFVRPLDQRIPSDDEDEEEEGNEDDEEKAEGDDVRGKDGSQGEVDEHRKREEHEEREDDREELGDDHDDKQDGEETDVDSEWEGGSPPQQPPIVSKRGATLRSRPRTRSKKRAPSPSTGADKAIRGGEEKGTKPQRDEAGENKPIEVARNTSTISSGGGKATAAAAVVTKGEEKQAQGKLCIKARPATGDDQSGRETRRLRRRINETVRIPALSVAAAITARECPETKLTNPCPSAGKSREIAAGKNDGQPIGVMNKRGMDGEGKDKETAGQEGRIEEKSKEGHDEGRQREGQEHDGKEEEEDDDGLPVVQTLEELRRFVRLEGSVVGHRRCMWADTFAHHVVSRRLGLTILFIDMEREKGAWPYRVLARAAGESRSAEGVVSRDDEEHEERFVVLKREPNHFVLLKALPVVGEGTAETRNGGGKSGGTVPLSKRGRACFRRSDLPDVVRTLWNIEPKARVT